MILGPRFHQKITVGGGQRILFDAPGSEVRGRSALSLVGGHVYVTSRQVAFTPNYLAVLVGRAPWVVPIAKIGVDVHSMVLGFPIRETEVVTLAPKPEAIEPPEPNTLFLRGDRNAELHDAIEKARCWG
jgi:hypothetical protein